MDTNLMLDTLRDNFLSFNWQERKLIADVQEAVESRDYVDPSDMETIRDLYERVA